MGWIWINFQIIVNFGSSWKLKWKCEHSMTNNVKRGKTRQLEMLPHGIEPGTFLNPKCARQSKWLCFDVKTLKRAPAWFWKSAGNMHELVAKFAGSLMRFLRKFAGKLAMCMNMMNTMKIFIQHFSRKNQMLQKWKMNTPINS